MADFVLVPGAWLGGWAFAEVATGLTRRGHRAVPVTLTGLGDRSHLSGRRVDLDTHVEDVVQTLDHEELEDAVLVGHSYGIFPAHGAAARRPRRVGRIVYVDTGIPGDGDVALEVAHPPERRARILETVEDEGDGWRWPLPPTDELDAIASVDGLSDEALSRLRRLAADQPIGTLTEPLSLPGGLPAVPTTGVLCTSGGVDLDAVRALVATGDARAAPLARSSTGFLELHTGHYPMLSCPDALVEALCEAAADGGTRIVGAPGEE